MSLQALEIISILFSDKMICYFDLLHICSLWVTVSLYRSPRSSSVQHKMQPKILEGVKWKYCLMFPTVNLHSSLFLRQVSSQRHNKIYPFLDFLSYAHQSLRKHCPPCGRCCTSQSMSLTSRLVTWEIYGEWVSGRKEDTEGKKSDKKRRIYMVVVCQARRIRFRSQLCH